LSPDEQLDLTGDRYAPFLEQGQKFGNDKVALSEDFVHNEEDTLVGFQAQKMLMGSNIPGAVTFTSLDSGHARFDIRDQGLTHKFDIAERAISASIEGDSDSDQDT